MKFCEGLQNGWEKLSSCIVNFVEKIFFLIGVKVAQNPWQTIVITWIFILLSAFGLIRFQHEKNPLKLWVPPDSDFSKDTEWFINTYGNGFRKQILIAKADNILEVDILQKLFEINTKVHRINVNVYNSTYSWRDLCFKVPDLRFLQMNINDSSLLNVEASIGGSFIYCELLNVIPQECYQQNIFDIWNFNNETFNYHTTSESIIHNIMNTKLSPTTGHPVQYVNLLGGVKRDNTDNIISAESLMFVWYIDVNYIISNDESVGNMFGTEQYATVSSLAWEDEFLKIMKNVSEQNLDFKVYYQAGRSYGDISGDTMLNDFVKIFIGVILMVIYIQAVLAGKSCLEIRFTLGSIGLLSVGMAYISSISWCSIIGIPYGPVHSSLPFLLMGLGVDDMFVMQACWEHLTSEERGLSIPLKVGYMLKHAGVSIVITSFTDIVAFIIGSITILPSLRSFCQYAAVGVFFIFCYSVTFYVAVLTLDERRIKANRNGILFCYKHKQVKQLESKETPFQRAFSFVYKEFIFKKTVKVFVILFTVGVTAFSIKCLFLLEQGFDPNWFIPDGTYFKEFINIQDKYYPMEGNEAFVFLGNMDYSREIVNLKNITHMLNNETYVKDVDSWIVPFTNYVNKTFTKDIYLLTHDEFNLYLSRFLFSSVGGRYSNLFKFTQKLVCGKPAPNITASLIPFKFVKLKSASQYIPAMHRVKDIVNIANITTGDGYRSVWSQLFANWVTDEMIGFEVERNIELALICVMACTIIMITNLEMCAWIFLCVLLTLINVCGFMQCWGMTIDIVSCIGLELAIGLCVDYAAHIGHTFLTISSGSRSERALKTVTSIGTAVLYGGGATLLSLSVLCMSKAYTFQCFFKIFLLVVFFGLFNGLVFLPIMLSLIGPNSYRKVEPSNSVDKQRELEVLNSTNNDKPKDELLN